MAREQPGGVQGRGVPEEEDEEEEDEEKAAVALKGKGWAGCGGGGTKSHLGVPRVPPLETGGAAKKMNSSCVKRAAAPKSRQPFHAARQLLRPARSSPAAAPAARAGLGSPEHSTAQPVPSRPAAPERTDTAPGARTDGAPDAPTRCRFLKTSRRALESKEVPGLPWGGGVMLGVIPLHFLLSFVNN